MKIFKDKNYHTYIDVHYEDDDNYYGYLYFAHKKMDRIIKTWPKHLHTWESFNEEKFQNAIYENKKFRR